MIYAVVLIIIGILIIYGILRAYSRYLDKLEIRDCRECEYFGSDGYPCDKCKWINRNAYGDHFIKKTESRDF